MHFSLKNILILVALSLFSLLKAQIYAPEANGVGLTSYSNSGKSDSIFIFLTSNTKKSIVAHLPDSASASFEWAQYTGSAYNTILSETTTVSSISDITASGGYRVIINSADSFYCWVFIQSSTIDITSTIDGDTIPNRDINCRTISYIKAEITDSILTYHNPLNQNSNYTYKSIYDILWGSDHPDATPPTPSYSLQVVVEEPYWEDTWYSVTAVNRDTKQSTRDTAFYKSVRPHAEFELPLAIPLDDSIYYPGRDPWYYEYAYNSSTYDHKSAPARFLFNNQLSKNADEYTWFFGDSITEKTVAGRDTISHKYNLPGTYYAYLIAKKNVDFLYDPCYDTFPKIGSDEDKIINKIEVEEAQDIDSTVVPNIFTSNHKKSWRFKEDVSISDFEIAIFNRFGKRVYHYKGNMRDWPGWDGTKNGGKNVSTGVYFYVVKKISALPDYETELLPKDLVLVKKGFIHYYNLGD